MGWLEQSPVSEGAIGERQSDKRACLVFLPAQLSGDLWRGLPVDSAVNG
jgi:hypothetical protein